MAEATWKPHEKHGRLTKQSDLPDSVYAFPKQRKEPLTDAQHVRNAVARFDQVIEVSDADRHRGICLGFDVPDNSFTAVQYVASRTPLQFPLTEAAIRKLLFTKYRGWSYEEEWRGWFRLDTRDQATGLFFYDFDDKIQLREVIVGPLCEIPKGRLEAVTGGYINPLHIIKARLAFETFRVVTSKLGFANS